jgi:hypothetical protein
MEPALSDLKPLIAFAANDSVNEPVFERLASRPPAFQVTFQGFGFPSTLKWRTLTFLDEAVEAVKNAGVVSLPMQIILPSLIRENQVHGEVRLCSVPLPLSS